MVRKIPWDIQESAILVYYYLLYESSSLSRSEAVKQASNELRQRAINGGKSIDDVFRNENGISMQMTKIEDLFGAERKRLGTPSKIFNHVVNLYKTDGAAFNAILVEARGMDYKAKLKQELFFQWLSNKKTPAQISELYFAFTEIEEFCMSRKIAQQPLFEIDSPRVVAKIKTVVDSNKVFRFKNRKQLGKMQSAISLYYLYVKEKHNDSIVSDDSTASPNGDVHDLDDTTEIIESDISISTSSASFQSWLVNVAGMSESTGRGYSSAINRVERLAEELHIGSTALYGTANLSAVKKNINSLLQNSSFIETNKAQHNQFSAALKKYTQFLDDIAEENSDSQYSKTQHFESNVDLHPYTVILQEFFPKGLRIDSILDLKRFIRHYNQKWENELDVADEVIRNVTKQNILQVGIQHDGYIFAAENLINTETKERLLKFIEEFFATGQKALFYKVLFEKFNDDFLDQHIYDEDMLRTYLIHIAADEFHFERYFMANESNVQIDSVEEVRTLLINAGSPIRIENICELLSHLPEDRVKWAIHSNKQFICNTWGEYFHISLIDLIDDELSDISTIISQTIELHRFISGNELIQAINAKYPHMLERFPEISMVGLRDAIAYFLRNDYAFNGNIISSLHQNLSMSDVFGNFARSHHTFSIDELNVLKGEMKSTIYFDAVYENSLRISQSQFVSKNEANFDVRAVDAAIDVFCPKKYISLRDVTNFGSFPYVGFPWNSYLLEHYVAEYSISYKLLHTSFNAENCVGAIVKCDSGISTFHDLLVDVLSHSDIELNKENALKYLCDMGYLARRRLSDINQILIKAKAQKG